MTQKEQFQQIIDEISKVVIGKETQIMVILCAILSGGHILIEDIPGVGKTMLAQAFSRAMGLEQNRVQFTPDVLPSDITGFSVYRREKETFVYEPGAVMCNLLLADEINRTMPKTQSALLQAMEEQLVTVDGVTRQLPVPFIVIATQNPVGYTGTQPLPESQIDRFMIQLALGYPEEDDELRILSLQLGSKSLSWVQPVIDRSRLLALQEEVRNVTVKENVFRYMIALAAETRKHPDISLGLSPRATLALAAMSRSWAYVNGRQFVIPSDTAAVFPYVAAHRIRLSQDALVRHKTAVSVTDEILKRVKQPVPERMAYR